jgi:hypothetical protein
MPPLTAVVFPVPIRVALRVIEERDAASGEGAVVDAVWYWLLAQSIRPGRDAVERVARPD